MSYGEGRDAGQPIHHKAIRAVQTSLATARIFRVHQSSAMAPM